MEQTTPAIASANPLAKHFRQPAIYFKLPSGGKYWPANTLNLPPNGEIGVMSMTTKDEITLKTPDALLNGQGVVNVIESCCPAIKDAWAMPSVDVDATLIAVRIASYGNQMDFTARCPHCDQSHDYAIDLGRTLASIEIPDYSIPLAVEGLKILLHPQAYFSLNKTNMIAFEEQQIIRSMAGLEDNPEEAKLRFDQHMAKIISLNIALLVNSTESIETEDGILVTDPDHIAEFYNNASNNVTKKVQGYLTELNEKAAIKPIDVNCLNEECLKEFPVNITFDYASFFRTRLLTLDNDAVAALIEGYEKEVRAYRDDALRMAWYMRGSISYEDAMLLSFNDRELINKIIKDNIETTEKTRLPFF